MNFESTRTNIPNKPYKFVTLHCKNCNYYWEGIKKHPMSCCKCHSSNVVVDPRRFNSLAGWSLIIMGMCEYIDPITHKQCTSTKDHKTEHKFDKEWMLV